MAAPTWPHWELQLLQAAGLPTTDGNKNWLANWNGYEHVSCARNPLNMSTAANGSTDCKKILSGRVAQAYATRGSAAFAFAEQLNLTDYPELRKAFLSGDPNSDPNSDGILLDLQKWGSVGWRKQYASLEGVDIGQTGGVGVTKASADVSGAWTRLHRVLSHEGHQTIVELQRAAASMRTIERRLRRV